MSDKELEYLEIYDRIWSSIKEDILSYISDNLWDFYDGLDEIDKVCKIYCRQLSRLGQLPENILPIVRFIVDTMQISFSIFIDLEGEDNPNLIHFVEKTVESHADYFSDWTKNELYTMYCLAEDLGEVSIPVVVDKESAKAECNVHCEEDPSSCVLSDSEDSEEKVESGVDRTKTVPPDFSSSLEAGLSRAGEKNVGPS